MKARARAASSTLKAMVKANNNSQIKSTQSRINHTHLVALPPMCAGARGPQTKNQSGYFAKLGLLAAHLRAVSFSFRGARSWTDNSF